jgi:hypothetical protein
MDPGLGIGGGFGHVNVALIFIRLQMQASFWF